MRALRHCCTRQHRHGRQGLPAMKRGMPFTLALLLTGARHLTRGFARKTSTSSSSEPPFLRSRKSGNAFLAASPAAPRAEGAVDPPLLVDNLAHRSRRTSIATCRLLLFTCSQRVLLAAFWHTLLLGYLIHSAREIARLPWAREKAVWRCCNSIAGAGESAQRFSVPAQKYTRLIEFCVCACFPPRLDNNIDC